MNDNGKGKKNQDYYESSETFDSQELIERGAMDDRNGMINSEFGEDFGDDFDFEQFNARR